MDKRKKVCKHCGSIVDAAAEVCPVCHGTEFRKEENDGTTILRFSNHVKTEEMPQVEKRAVNKKPSGNKKNSTKKTSGKKKISKKQELSPFEKKFMKLPLLTRKLILILAAVILILTAVLIAGGIMKGCSHKSEPVPTPIVAASMPPQEEEPVPTIDPNAPMGTILVKEEQINIRTSPDTNGEIVDVLEKGRTYDVYEIQRNSDYTWYRIGDDQWVADQNGEWMSYTGRVQ